MHCKKIVKYMSALIPCIMIALVLSGCGNKEEKMGMSADKKDDRIVLILGNYDMNRVSDPISKYVDAFNKANNTYRIEIRDYSKSEDCDTALNLDMASGKTPDIIVMNWDRVDKLIHTGILADMQSDMDLDEELDKGDFLDSVMSAWKEEDSLYYVSSVFSINSMFGREKTVGQYSNGWTRKDMMDFADTSEVPLFYENGKMTLFGNFFATGYSEFVNWDTGKANFDSDLFRRILKYCDQGDKDSDRYPVGAEWAASFREGKNSLVTGPLHYYTDIESYTRVFGSDLCFVGCPNDNRDIAYMQFDECVGISAQSEYHDVAWKFVRSLLTKDAQYLLSAMQFPVRKDIFEIRKKEVMTKEEYTDEYGHEIYPIDYITGDNIRITSLTQEEADLVEKLVSGAKHCIRVDHKIGEIVLDEVAAYFNGDCTLDRVGETINSRVETYMNENR